MNKKTLFVAASLLAATLMGVAHAATPNKKAPGTKRSIKKLQDDFRKLKFGMFIHYNMATYKGALRHWRKSENYGIQMGLPTFGNEDYRSGEKLNVYKGLRC